ncbi:MAG: hypothetical protein JWR50_2544 [Mucilaginibacter sp.]|nr:hypothetical protein [Mucilaginibacter sp.]
MFTFTPVKIQIEIFSTKILLVTKVKSLDLIFDRFYFSLH